VVGAEAEREVPHIQIMRNPSYPRSLGKYQAWYVASGKQRNSFEALSRGKPVTGHMGKSSPDRGTGNAGLIRVHRESGGLAMVSRNGGGSVTGQAKCGRPATGTGKVASLLWGTV